MSDEDEVELVALVLTDEDVEGGLDLMVGQGVSDKGPGWFARVKIGKAHFTGGPFDTEEQATSECEVMAKRVCDALAEQGVEMEQSPEGWESKRPPRRDLN